MVLAYVDPQSYHNLAKYDVGYLHGLCHGGYEGEIRFYCSDLFDEPTPAKVEVSPVFRYNRKQTSIVKLLSYAVSMLRILAGAFRSPVDVYHFQWFKFPPLDLLFVFIVRRIGRAQVVFTAHNVVPHGLEEARHWLLGILYREVDHIVVHHGSTADELVRRFSLEPSRISVMRHGVISLEPKGTPRHRDRVSDFVAAHDTCFLFFGYGRRYKGLDILLEAWPTVMAASGKTAGLIIMGAVDADLKTEARRLASQSGETVLLVDEVVSEADLFYAVQQCDVVILPHRSISQSGVLLSVLGLGVPVLVSALPGLLEPFRIAKVGWQFDGTVAGLSTQMIYLAEDPKAVRDVRSNSEGWDAVKRSYGWETIARSGERLYTKLLTPIE